MPVKRPKFGHPRGAGSPVGIQPIPAGRLALEVGATVSLWYKKRTVLVKVEKIGPERTYEGTIERFEPPAETFEELAVGDTVGFRRDNVREVH